MQIGKITKVNKDENGNILSVEVEKEHSGTHNNGYIFKDFGAYERGLDEICYVPEYSGVNSEITDFYTHRDFLELCGGQEHIAEIIFDMVDWQHPETLIDELFGNDELDYCPECEKMLLIYDLEKCTHCGCELVKI